MHVSIDEANEFLSELEIPVYMLETSLTKYVRFVCNGNY